MLKLNDNMSFKNIVNKQLLKIADLLPASAMRHISYRVSQLIDDQNFHNDDIEDPIQELAVAVLNKMKNYKQQTPSSNGTRFFNKIIDNKISDFRRRQRRQNKGKETTTMSADWDIEENNDLSRILGSSSVELSSRQQTIEEVRDVLGTLPENHRMFCGLIMQGYSFEKMESSCGVKSVTLRTRRISQIHKCFEKAGFIFSEKKCIPLCGSEKNKRKNNKEGVTNTCWPQGLSSVAIVTSEFQSNSDGWYNTAVSVCSDGYASSCPTANLCGPQGICFSGSSSEFNDPNSSLSVFPGTEVQDPIWSQGTASLRSSSDLISASSLSVLDNCGTYIQANQGIVFCSSNGFYSSTDMEGNHGSTEN